MANHIIGLDFGTHSIKLVRIERGRDPQVIGYDEEPLPRLNERPAPAGNATEAGDEFEDAPTQVRHRDDVAGAQGEDGGPPPMPGGPETEAPQNEAAGDDHFGPEDDEPTDDAQSDDEHADDTGRWEAALDRLIERGAFDDDGLVVTFLPNGQAMSIHQPVPFAERSKVENILPHMLNDRLPVDPSKVVYDFQLIESTVEEGAEAVVGFARKEQVGEFLGELKRQHVDPAVLGIPELLLTYALERCAPVDEGTYAVVDIGHEYTRVLVLHQREPAVARSVQFGGHNLTKAIAERFDSTYEQAENLKENHAKILGPEDAPSGNQRLVSDALEQSLKPFVRDLRRTFQSLYARTRIKIDEIYVCGGTSKLGNLPEFMSREFGVPVRRFPIDRIPGMPLQPGDEVSKAPLAMAASAALQQIDGRDEERLIDLRKDEFTYRGKSSYLRSQMVKYGAAAAVLLFLLVGMLFSQKIQMEAQRDAMRAALTQQTTKLFGEPVYTNDKIKKRLTGESSSKKGYIPEMSAYQLYYELASNISQDIDLTISRFEVDVDRNVAQVYGETTSPQAVEQLMDNMRQLECLKDVRQEGELKIKGDSEVDFHLHISSECS
ncbi:hypothetical protein FIV42_05020 [Persicimonas caeni]|uniref:Type IV pilus assembly protein PilM n=1 Tax=Persicimonas caeni TaxID=2292766 RepID=A0A4Y6PQ39_PERCE|nr:pilus assembly protein PilM [Persicimonas caeni]QDG50117.1 hypothetical protein FIV42_05020 [Persicimonas caeni]QED31338.1 hypothetical protein FRD00_05015 [Persicimonas caeni]